MGRPTDERKDRASVHIQPSLKASLYALSVRTRIPMAELIREGIELVIKARAPKHPKPCFEGGPHNTYRAVTATGAILRGNNRRRLQKRLRGAVIQELAAVCAAERRAGERQFERMLKRRNARIAKGRAA